MDQDSKKQTLDDMRTTLDHAKLLYDKHLNVLCRVSEKEQEDNLGSICVYFRCFLHCWKCVPDYAFEMHRIPKKDKAGCMSEWFKTWPEFRNDNAKWTRLKQAYDDLRNTRDTDTHKTLVSTSQEVRGQASSERVVGVAWPEVCFQPFDDKGKHKGGLQGILEHARKGLEVADRLIKAVQQGEFPPGERTS